MMAPSVIEEKCALNMLYKREKEMYVRMYNYLS